MSEHECYERYLAHRDVRRDNARCPQSEFANMYVVINEMIIAYANTPDHRDRAIDALIILCDVCQGSTETANDIVSQIVD
jgi:hypothetical protein